MIRKLLLVFTTFLQLKKKISQNEIPNSQNETLVSQYGFLKIAYKH